MTHVFKKSAMAFSALIFALSGFIIAGPDRVNPVILALIALMLVWAGLEFYIGFSRPTPSFVPASRSTKIWRMLWPLSVLYSWFDLRFGWTAFHLSHGILIILFAVYCAGLCIRISAVVYLGKSFTYDVKRPEGNVLITTGPYRFVRHPGYLGIIILAALPGLIVGSAVGFAGLMIQTVTVTVKRIHEEDRMLEQEFGTAFREYERKTYRLAPFVY